jgi:hypothetical protein
MLTDFILKYPTATIAFAQTTFMHLEVEDGRYRVDFREKVEVRLKPGRGGELSYHTHHPLLLRHNEQTATVYLNSVPDDPGKLCDDIRKGIAGIFQEWRDSRSEFFGSDLAIADGRFKQNLTQGGGILLDSAPSSIAQVVIAACDRHGVATKAFGSTEPDSNDPPEYSLLFIGSCYVIAKDFTVRQL